MIVRAIVTLLVLIIIGGCIWQVSDYPSPPSIEMEGSIVTPNSVYDRRESDDIHEGLHFNKSGENHQLAVGQVVGNLGVDNEFTILEGGCLLRRRDSHLFDVVSCTDALAEGCLEDELHGNIVVYEQPCPSR